MNVIADTFYVPLKESDRLLLCSDGLYDMVPSSHTKDILQEPIPADERVDKLIDAALEAGGKDNVTVIVIDLMK